MLQDDKGTSRDDTRDTSDPDYEPTLDMSPSEWSLSLNDPVGYGYKVDGIRHIFVKDESIELRYLYRDGQVILKDIKVW